MGTGIIQSLPIFIVKLQTAKRELLKNFELPDDSRPHQNATQRRRVVKNGRSLTLNWKRYQIWRSAAWVIPKPGPFGGGPVSWLVFEVVPLRLAGQNSTG